MRDISDSQSNFFTFFVTPSGRTAGAIILKFLSDVLKVCLFDSFVNHMINTFYPIENNAITNKLLLCYKTKLKSPEQEKIT